MKLKRKSIETPEPSLEVSKLAHKAEKAVSVLDAKLTEMKNNQKNPSDYLLRISATPPVLQVDTLSQSENTDLLVSLKYELKTRNQEEVVTLDGFRSELTIKVGNEEASHPITGTIAHAISSDLERQGRSVLPKGYKNDPDTWSYIARYADEAGRSEEVGDIISEELRQRSKDTPYQETGNIPF